MNGTGPVPSILCFVSSYYSEEACPVQKRARSIVSIAHQIMAEMKRARSIREKVRTPSGLIGKKGGSRGYTTTDGRWLLLVSKITDGVSP